MMIEFFKADHPLLPEIQATLIASISKHIGVTVILRLFVINPLPAPEYGSEWAKEIDYPGLMVMLGLPCVDNGLTPELWADCSVFNETLLSSCWGNDAKSYDFAATTRVNTFGVEP
ncbi:MAG: hypothetical protein HC877_18805 [Thioploca sp.]|nr:hypothetical protein [Thioploca sp.]